MFFLFTSKPLSCVSSIFVFFGAKFAPPSEKSHPVNIPSSPLLLFLPTSLSSIHRPPPPPPPLSHPKSHREFPWQLNFLSETEGEQGTGRCRDLNRERPCWKSFSCRFPKKGGTSVRLKANDLHGIRYIGLTLQ